MPAERGADRAAGARVERGERFVEQERAWLGRERAGERDALALAAGKALGQLALDVRDAQLIEQLERALCAICCRFSRRAAREREGDVVARGEVREERIVLRDVAEAAPLRREVDPGVAVEQHLAAELDAAAFWSERAEQQLEHAALAGAARARERERAGADLELDLQRDRRQLGLHPRA